MGMTHLMKVEAVGASRNRIGLGKCREGQGGQKQHGQCCGLHGSVSYHNCLPHTAGFGTFIPRHARPFQERFYPISVTGETSPPTHAPGGAAEQLAEAVPIGGGGPEGGFPGQTAGSGAQLDPALPPSSNCAITPSGLPWIRRGLSVNPPCILHCNPGPQVSSSRAMWSTGSRSDDWVIRWHHST